MLVWCGGLKGAVPLLLATLPALEALDDADRVQGVVLVATAASIVVQGWTLRAVAAAPGRRPSACAGVGLQDAEQVALAVLHVRVPADAGHRLAARRPARRPRR